MSTRIFHNYHCIASKLGDINAFGADPRRVITAGHDVDNIEPIDFSTKYKNQNDAFKARFDSLGSKFNGKTLDDYVNGKSFCCGDKNLDEIEKNNTQTAENAKLEDNLYFYHPDHLGSTSMVTNYDGDVTQNVAYIPYGEVFVEERNGSWATPFLFNAKELDEETGLYYYGARYLDPTMAAWLSVDPKIFDYPGMSPYNYCANSPVKYVDPDGKEKLIALDPNTDENIIRAAKSYSNNEGVVHLWGHGVQNNKGENYAIKINDNYIRYSQIDEFKEYLFENSKIYKSNNTTVEGGEAKTTLLVLHSCKTGQKDGFAQNISKELNAVIVAPTQNIEVQTIIQQDGKKTSKEKGIQKKGSWSVYYKGELMENFSGSIKPIFKDAEKTIAKYVKMWNERHKNETKDNENN